MGLDMYLTKKIFVGAEYESREVKGTIELTSKEGPIKVDVSKVVLIIESAGYWRKANQIHNWFVKYVQGGKDECEETYVPYEKFMELKNLCQRVLDTKDSTLLPPVEGFFFGSTEIDDYYWEQIKETIQILTGLDPEADYFYRSSW